MQNKKPKRILLLTHKDSDNLGDQLIEVCDMSLLHTIMKNLGFQEGEYEIIDEKAAIVTPQYVNSRDPKLLKRARKLIKNADLVIVGGAPQFNYLYQYFSERSVVLIKLAKKYNKPILFSSIGIEDYDPEHPKCKRVKEALKSDCVKMVTTRDNLTDLKRLRTRKEMVIGQVADPAVWSAYVFRNFVQNKQVQPPAEQKTVGMRAGTFFGRMLKKNPEEIQPPKREESPQKIGIFLIRGGAFTANHIDFTEEDATNMWLDLTAEIQARGYDYEFITSGHFADEVFMDHLVRDCGVKLAKCVFNMYKPEQLIEKISSYAGVISCRLHPGIVSYSLEVPAVGIVWNPKVPGFYNAIDYPERLIYKDDISAPYIMDKLESAMKEGVHHNEAFMTSVYSYLFNAVKKELCPENEATVYDYDRIIAEMPLYPGTTESEAQDKLRRQTRRCYKNYNAKERELKSLKEAHDLEKHPVFIRYFSKGGKNLQCMYKEEGGKEELFKNGGHEYTAPTMLFHNNGKDRVDKIQYIYDGYQFIGWNIRVRSDDTWFWYMKNTMLCSRIKNPPPDFDQLKYVVGDEEVLPVLPLKRIDSVVLEACWEKE